MIRYKHTKNGIILRYITRYKVYHKLYINHTLAHAKIKFIEFLDKEVKQ